MEVFVPKLNQNGTIISINNDSVMLQIGIIKTSFKINDFRLQMLWFEYEMLTLLLAPILNTQVSFYPSLCYALRFF